MGGPSPLHETGGQSGERAVLIGTVLRGIDPAEEEENLRELSLLAKTAGARVLHASLVRRPAPDVATYIGKGKVEEVAELCRERDANLIIFDNDLSPVQARNLETATGINVCDRSELILDIFAQHARTRQSRLQVEMAQLEYLRPRLRRMWEHLSRQAGGIGTRGPGETQIEVDRRRLGERISHLKRELEKLERISETQARRRRSRAFTVALVGYTNVGKSSLMNALTDADVLVEDTLFATLDARTRRLSLGSDDEILLTDTVGFIRKLPHHLVESFKATLSEVRHADLVLHVSDVSSSWMERQVEAVDEVLGQLDVDPQRCLPVYNKADLIKDSSGHRRIDKAHLVSATTGEGLDELKAAILDRRRESFQQALLLVQPGKEKAAGSIYRHCEVRDVQYEDEGTYYRVRVSSDNLKVLVKLGILDRSDSLA